MRQKSQFFMNRKPKSNTPPTRFLPVPNPFRLLCAALLCAALPWAGCGGDAEKTPRPDVSKITAPVRFQRFEQDLFALDTATLAASMAHLNQKYPVFLPFFVSEVIHDQTNPQETPLQALSGFLKAQQVRRLYDSCQLRHANLDWLQRELEPAFKYYQYYFPEKKAPTVVTAVTEFVGDAYLVNDTLLMLGLDFFMGPDFSGYNPDYFPEYLRRQFQPDYMPIKLATALATGSAGQPASERILDLMLHNGKILYLVDCLLPDTPDSLKMGYTSAQMEGCQANEAEVWARLLDLKVLYQPLSDANQKIVMPSPAAEMVFQEAPGEVGNWVGWQIVRAYMKRHPDTSMAQLMTLRDGQKFLEQSRYKPKRN